MVSRRAPSDVTRSRGMTRFDDAFVPLAVATRSGFDESLYHGAAVALAADGSVIASVGDPDVVGLPALVAEADAGRRRWSNSAGAARRPPGRSSAPATTARRCTSPPCARCSATFGLDEADLRNTPSLPFDAAAGRGAPRRRAGPSAISQNCSRQARRDARHVPRQRLADRPTTWSPSTRCRRRSRRRSSTHGAPVHARRHRRLWRADARDRARRIWPGVRRIAVDGPPVRRVDDGATRHGRRPDARRHPLDAAVPGLVAKDGADGVMAGALPDGRAFALKIADGADGARQAGDRAGAARARRRRRRRSRAAGRQRPVVPGHGARGRARSTRWRGRRCAERRWSS